jgi:hypothetical protein
MPSRFTRFLPPPAMAVALVAVVLSATGLAFAAIPDSKGVIHSCYAKSDGALRVVNGTKCQSGEKKLKWSQRGPQGKPGKPGAAGATHLTVRSTNLTYHYGPCGMIAPSTYVCNAPGGSATANCNAGERATGGGYGNTSDAGSPAVQESGPTPATGTPTGWTVTTAASAVQSTTATHADTAIPVRVVCAAP